MSATVDSNSAASDYRNALPPGESGAVLRDSYVSLLRDAILMTIWDAEDGSVSPAAGSSHADLRSDGRDWPRLAHSMIGTRRMANLQFCVEDVLARGVPGDLMETGVWRGGSCIFMRGILRAYGITDRTVWVADSFEGLPPANKKKYPIDADGFAFDTVPVLAVSMATVQDNFRRYGLLDSQVRMVKGFFRDSLPTAPVEQLAVLRLDGDMYESTIDALTNLYHKLSDGGYLIVDDYSIPGCREAVKDFRAANGIEDPIEVIDWTGVYWRKGSAVDESLADEIAAIEAQNRHLLAAFESPVSNDRTTSGNSTSGSAGEEQHMSGTRYRPYIVDVDAPNNPHAYELQMIGLGKRVLELGAAGGDITRALVERGCDVTVVEYDEINREDLLSVTDKVVMGDLNDPATLQGLAGPFDAVLCGDVLEHLLDPARVLRDVIGKLSPEGQIVVSVPNIAHVDIRLALLDGRFDYTSVGLLDRTHIRFFTRKTIDELMAETGLAIVDMRKVVVPPFASEQASSPDLFPADLVARILEDEDAQTYQFVFAAVPDTRENRSEVLSGKYAQLRKEYTELRDRHDRLKFEHEVLNGRLYDTLMSRPMRYSNAPRLAIQKLRGVFGRRPA